MDAQPCARGCTSRRVGNIDPLGITATPAIDEHTQAIYLDAMIRDKASGESRHRIFALSLRDGSVLAGWPVDVEASLESRLYVAADQRLYAFAF